MSHTERPSVVATFVNRFLLACILITCVLPACAKQEHKPGAQQRVPLHAEVTSAVPREAVQVYEYVLQTGRAPDGYVGGRVWQNRERRLPRGGTYREYDIRPRVRGKNRGPERIVVDLDTKKGWYTGDHYRTFILIEQTYHDGHKP